MVIKINGASIPVMPKSFSVTAMDLDDGDSTTRASDGTLNRDRIATKRQIEMEWGLLSWDNIAQILQSMADKFFQVYYPDPMEGTSQTKTFYVGNRPCPVAYEKNGKLLWNGLKVTLTER